MSIKILKAAYQSFQMRYYRYLLLKVLQNCRPSNFDNVCKSSLEPKIVPSFFELSIEIACLWATRVRTPDGADFEGLQLCSPLSYKDVYHPGAALGFEIDGAKGNLVSKIGVISGS